MKVRMLAALAVVVVALAACVSGTPRESGSASSASSPLPTSATATKLELPDRSNAKAAKVSLPSSVDEKGAAFVEAVGGRDVQPGRYVLKIPDAASGAAECRIDILRPEHKSLAPYDYRENYVKTGQIQASGGIFYAADVAESDEITVTCYGLQSFTLEFEPLATKKLTSLPYAGDWVAGLDFEPGRYRLEAGQDRLFTSIYATDGALTSRGVLNPRHRSVVAELAQGETLSYSAALDRTGTAHGGQLQLDPTDEEVASQTWSASSAQDATEFLGSTSTVYEVGKDISPGFYRLDITGDKPVEAAYVSLVSADGDELVCVQGDVEAGSVAPANVAVMHLVAGQLVEFRVKWSGEESVRGRKRKADDAVRLVPAERAQANMRALKSGIYMVGDDIPAGLYEIGATDATEQELNVVTESGLLAHYDPDRKRARAKTQNIELESGQALMVADRKGFELRPKR